MSRERNFFEDGATYERGMGRLSRVAGEEFLNWLNVPSGLRWLDVGCGTGSFTELLLHRKAPDAISAIDPSEEQIAFAKSKPDSSRIDFRQGDAMSLPFGDGEFDVAVMALVIQYISDRPKAMSEIARVVRPKGTVAAYVWPGPGQGHPMQPLNDAFRSIGASRSGRPGNRIRTIEALVELWNASGLEDIESRSLEIQLNFRNFDDYWLSQSGEATRYLTDGDMERLESVLRESLPTDKYGQISYMARVNAVTGRVTA